MACVRTQPEWSVSRLIHAVKAAHKAPWPHMKLIHKGRILEACQKIVELGLFGGDLLHAVLLRGPQPGVYRGGSISKDDQSYVRTGYTLTVLEDGAFVLQRVVSSDVVWALPDEALTGCLGPEAEFQFHTEQPDLELEVTLGGVSLTAPFDEVDGGSVRKSVLLHLQML
uniref:Ubiquitin-like domain-containing protein n=1 Tax=Alexandrium monilatum TaxID=311494 RepID=A0A7S4VUY2_9DINO